MTSDSTTRRFTAPTRSAGTRHAALLAALLLLPATAGCLDALSGDDDNGDAGDAATTYQGMGFDGTDWPDLTGHTVTILDHGAFFAFDDAKTLFENLTGATVVHVSADDTGSALQQACLEATASATPTFDVVYGIDNAYFGQAMQCAGGRSIFTPYTPLLADRVAPGLVFFDDGDIGTWPATPVDHGYIALNVDIHHDALDNVSIANLHDVAANADLFVTQDPRTSSPGLGFLLATIGRFPENNEGRPDWKDYWSDLFEGGAKITAGWSEAYEIHFSGGYGKWLDGHVGDRPIVTSYTTSPAYEHYYEAPEETLAEVLLDRSATFHQVQTMGILNGTGNLAASQAWIEFTLTDDFQNLAAASNAVYPAVSGLDVSDVYGGLDPEPGSFSTARLAYRTIADNLEDWIDEWVEQCEFQGCV